MGHEVRITSMKGKLEKQLWICLLKITGDARERSFKRVMRSKRGGWRARGHKDLKSARPDSFKKFICNDGIESRLMR